MLFPINLVYSRCPIYDTKLKKLHYLQSDLKHRLKTRVRLNEHEHNWFLLKRFRQVLILVDPVDDEEIVHKLIFLQ
jgi:hypothetical protein